MAHFEVKNLSFSYATSPEKVALKEVSVQIEQGAYITICGKSGSGKTTLLRHLKSVLTPYGERTGEVLFKGKKLADISERDQASEIGFVMQNPEHQIVTDKVWHELAFGLESLGYDQKEIRLRVAEMASFFGIQNWFHKDVSELSGGQKQLLNLASIMAMQPSVLILDEPTSQLDPIAAADFLNTVRKINRELRTTIIITEHRLEDILYASDQVIVMDQGRIVANDRPEKIGEYLKTENNDMFAAMPTPMQVYYGVPNKLKCPLTVREGAEWLELLLAGKNLRIREINDEKTLYDESQIKSPAVELKEVWFRYEKKAQDVLKGVSMKVPRNSIFAVVGGNGTGKSTMLKSIGGMCKPYRGKVKVEGRLSMLPQDPQDLFGHGTVEEELKEMLSGKDVAGEETLETVVGICEIKHLLKQHPYALSGGEQQRVALAKVLLTEPEVLLLDEPTKGIDSYFKLKFAQILEKLKEKGVTIILVSHDIEFCAKYADMVSMFFDGGIVTTNTPNRFFSGNGFYTTAANRMSRHVFKNAIINEEVISLCQLNL